MPRQRYVAGLVPRTGPEEIVLASAMSVPLWTTVMLGKTVTVTGTRGKVQVVTVDLPR